MSNNRKNALIIAAVLVALIAVVFAKTMKNKTQGSCCPELFVGESNLPAVQVTVDNKDVNQAADQNSLTAQARVEEAKLPGLVDLGAGKCIPCKMMKPILEELRQDYKEQFQVTFIDVWENHDRAKKYNIKMIPTQIFFDNSGKEIFRHEGFFSKENILAKWKELGIEIKEGN